MINLLIAVLVLGMPMSAPPPSSGGPFIPKASYTILCFDESGYLCARGFDNLDVRVDDMAFFKFGSVIGFDNNPRGEDRTWPSDGSAIRFNPSHLNWGEQMTAYNAGRWSAETQNKLPGIPGYTIDDYPKLVSGAYATVENLKTGKGDPCMLVGYTGAQLRAMNDVELQAVLDNAVLRLPTSSENLDFLISNLPYRWTPNSVNGTDPGIGAFGIYRLPAAGYRGYGAGEVLGQGAYGGYWSSMPASDQNGYYLCFHSGCYIDPEGQLDYSTGLSIRCVPR